MWQNAAMVLHLKGQSDQDYLHLSHYLHLHPKQTLTNVKPNAFKASQLAQKGQHKDVCPKVSYSYQLACHRILLLVARLGRPQLQLMQTA